MSNFNICPTNFTIKEDCCVKSDLNINNIQSDNINNSVNITTNNLHITGEGYLESLYNNNSHILIKQTVAPTTTHTGTGLTGSSLTTNSTDISGMVLIVGTALINETVIITFHEPYPVGSIPVVTLTAATDTASNNIGVTGIATSATNTAFTITFTAAATVTDGANPSFYYHVVCPVPA